MTADHDPAPDASADNLYGVAAIAAFLGMPEKPCRHRVEKGEIPTFKIGAIRCARRSTLNTWLAEREAAALAAQHRPLRPQRS